MKTQYFILTILILSITISCNKGDCTDGEQNQDEVSIDCGGDCAPCNIEYPETGTYGTNILHIDDTIYLGHFQYSFRAVIPEGSTLKIKLNSVSGGAWWYSVGSNIGWSISDYEAGAQYFEALNETCELEVDLSFLTGMFQVWFYENSESVTRVGYVYVN